MAGGLCGATLFNIGICERKRNRMCSKWYFPMIYRFSPLKKKTVATPYDECMEKSTCNPR